MKSGFKTVLKTSALGLMALSFMGNQGCEQKPAETGRFLKKRVALSSMKGPTMTLPDGGKMDFEYLANSQLYSVALEHPKISLPFGQMSMALNDQQEAMSFNRQDYNLLSTWSDNSKLNLWATSPVIPECVKRVPQFEVGGKVESFEIVGGGGLFFGAGPNFDAQTKAGLTPQLGASINVQFAQMATNMQASDGFNHAPFASANTTATQTKVDLNLSIDFGMFRFGPKFFFQSPLAKVSRNALTQNIDMLVQNFDAISRSTGKPLWETTVRTDEDTHVIIYAGRLQGLKVGDEFKIYNMDHYWADPKKPCQSRHDGAIPRTDEPVAIVRIDNESALGDEISRALVIQESGDQREAGARVEILKLMPDAPATPAQKP